MRGCTDFAPSPSNSGFIERDSLPNSTASFHRVIPTTSAELIHRNTIPAPTPLQASTDHSEREKTKGLIGLQVEGIRDCKILGESLRVWRSWILVLGVGFKALGFRVGRVCFLWSPAHGTS